MTKLIDLWLNSKINEKIHNAKIAEFLRKKEELEVLEEKKKPNKIVIILAIIGAIAAVAGIAYAVYRFVAPRYLDDFDDEFEDDVDAEIFDEDEDDK